MSLPQTLSLAKEALRLERYQQPERLFVRGLRGILNGFENGHGQDWVEAWTLFTERFGDQESRMVLDALWRFAGVYRAGAPAHGGYHRLGCPCMRRDEYLCLTLVSALQNQEVMSGRRSLDVLATRGRQNPLLTAANELAIAFLRLNLRFLPPVEHQVVNVIRASSRHAENAPVAVPDAATVTLH